MQRFLPLLIVCLLVSPAIVDGADKPNIVVVLVDDLGWTDLSCQGSKLYETPNVDRLAKEGMQFTNGYAACAVCSPTRSAALTGRYPSRVGVTDWIRARFQGGVVEEGQQTPADYVGGPNNELLCPRNPLFMELGEHTLAEALKEQGYTTCYIGKWHLGPDKWYPEKQGFDFNFGGCDLGQPLNYFDPYTAPKLPGGIPTLKPRKEGEYLTDREGDEAAAFIRDHKDTPFLLYLANYAVHTPIQAKKDLIEKYKAKLDTLPASNQKNATYAAMVESMDDSVGQVLAALEETSLSDKTLILFTSDNGGLLGPTHNAPLRSGKGFPYEGGIRVPFLVRWPGNVKPGSKCDIPVCSIDLFPTLIQVAGGKLPTDREIDGQSILPLLQQSPGFQPRGMQWHFPHYRGGLAPYSIFRLGDWKLIYRWETDQKELYNLSEDLSETTDLASEQPLLTAHLYEMLQASLADSDAKLPKANPDWKGS
jgi:arylsulfatase A